METPVSPIAATTSHAPAVPRTGWRRGGAALAYAVRLALVVGALLAWTIQGLLPAWDAWHAAAQTPSAAGVSYDEQRLTLEGSTLYPLFVAARSACPPTAPELGISEDIRADQQGNYMLYPRRIDIVRDADPLDQAAITAHRGGCVFTYGPSAARLDPFRAQLTELACTRDGCLYRIK
jgi:hypothetical protein